MFHFQSSPSDLKSCRPPVFAFFATILIRLTRSAMDTRQSLLHGLVSNTFLSGRKYFRTAAIKNIAGSAKIGVFIRPLPAMDNRSAPQYEFGVHSAFPVWLMLRREDQNQTSRICNGAAGDFAYCAWVDSCAVARLERCWVLEHCV